MNGAFFIDVNETMMELHRKLHRACIKGDVDTVNNLIRINKEKIDAKQLDQMGTLLKSVSQEKFFPSLEQLQEVMKNDPQVEIVKLLCEMGVDLEQKDHDGKTALHLAVRGNKMIHYSYKFHANQRIVKVLLEHGASVHGKDCDGNTPFLKACGSGNSEVVQTLIKYHADVHSTNKMCETPLHKACWGGTSEIVQILLEHGASVHAKDCNGYTPLHDVCRSGKLEVVQTLIQHHADIHASDNMRRTPLHHACWGGHLEIVQELLKHKPNINALCKGNGIIEMTPIICAALRGRFEIVEELLKHGTDIDFSNPQYGSALHIAIEYEHEQTVKTLLKHGCKTNVQAKLNMYGEELPMCTAFELALNMKSINIVKTIAYHQN